MSDLPTLNAAGEPIDPKIRYVRVARRGVVGGLGAGTLAVSLVLWSVRTILLDAPPSDKPVASGIAPDLLLFGVIGGAFLAGGLAWWRLAAIDSTFRRGGLSLVASVATMVVAIAATPVYHAFGRNGLLALAALGAAGMIMCLRPRSDEVVV